MVSRPILNPSVPGRDGIPKTQAPGVVATGQCDVPRIPELARRLPGWIRQLSPSEYRNPDELPDGGVLVVGAWATGVKLAAEIRRSGRFVTLSAGRHTRLTRRYRRRHALDLSRALRGPGVHQVLVLHWTDARAKKPPIHPLHHQDAGHEALRPYPRPTMSRRNCTTNTLAG
jgi:cation diffusion facilitator CzcD-associated flavoprotein CzcO